MDKKTERIIDIHNRLRDGRVIIKSEEANRHNVNDRTIQRDLDDIRAYYSGQAELGKELVYDRGKKVMFSRKRHAQPLQIARCFPSAKYCWKAARW